MSAPGTIAALLALAGLALLTGCSTTRVVYQDTALARPALEAGRVLIGAVAGLGGGEYIGADAVAEVTASEFSAARPWLTMLPLAGARVGFVPGQYDALLRNVAEQGHWREADFKAFQWATNQARYLLVVELVQSREFRYHSRIYSEGNEYSRSPYDYDVVVGGSRRLKIAYHLFDLQRGRTVWLAVARTSRSAQRRQAGYINLYNPVESPGVPSVPELSRTTAHRAAGFLPR